MDDLAIYVGYCRNRLPTPPIPAELVACEAEGCPHLVWCDSNRAPEWHALKVVCTHCALTLLPKVAG
jgi:hypothetical protein